jgi:hypothetical protein
MHACDAETGSTGVCTECPADSYRSDTDPPVQCVPCPATSHTFSLGATSAKDCLCAAGSFNDQHGENSSFSCATVPEGGWAPQADSRLFALANYWRPDPSYTRFYACTTGMCQREEPALKGTAQLGYNCREGHTVRAAVGGARERGRDVSRVAVLCSQLPGVLVTPCAQGHLCAVCADGYAYQGIYCSKCDITHRYSAWSASKKGGLVFVGLFLICFFTFVVFLLPLFPRTEVFIETMTMPVVEQLETMLGNMANAARRVQSSRPQSAAAGGGRGGGGGGGLILPAPSAEDEEEEEDGYAEAEYKSGSPLSQTLQSQASQHIGVSHLSRPTRTMRRSSHTNSIRRSSHTVLLPAGDAPPPDSGDGEVAPATRIRVQRPSRIVVFLDVIAEPVRSASRAAPRARLRCCCARG